MTKSIRKRFVISVAANVLRSGISFATVLLMARWLGSIDFGRIMFLLASFVALRQLLDMSSSNAFFTFLSQRQRSRRFILYYWFWFGLQFLVAILLVGFLIPQDWIASIWVNEKRSLVLLGLVAAFMQQGVWPIAVQMAEASRETIKVQKLNTVIVFLHLFVIVCLWFFGFFAVPILLVVVALEWGIGAWLAIRLYRPLDDTDCVVDIEDTPKSVWREYWAYCLPLIPLTLLGFAHTFGDRWMLQHWGGASEQAYFSVAQQFSAVALLATTSVLRIFWKEIAEAHHQGNFLRVKQVYWKISRLLYFIAAIVTGALISWSNEIINLLLGSNYIAGSLTLMVMFLYPVHQCLGQITGSYLMATNKTNLYSKFGMIVMPVGLIATYFITAPKTAVIPGLDLGSQGIALKMVCIQLISVNVLIWYIARINSWRFDYLHQIVCLLLAITLGWFSKNMTVMIASGLPELIQMIIAFFIYLVIILFIFNLKPSLAGIDKDSLDAVKSQLAKAISITKISK